MGIPSPAGRHSANKEPAECFVNMVVYVLMMKPKLGSFFHHMVEEAMKNDFATDQFIAV